MSTQTPQSPAQPIGVFDSGLGGLTVVRELRRVLPGPGAGGRSIPARFIEVRNYIGAHYRDRIRLASLAARCGLSAPYFGAQFRKYFEVSPIELIVRLRLDEAVHHLADVNLNISEIARRVGYDDIYYFSKLFKKRYGLSPRQFRKRRAGRA